MSPKKFLSREEAWRQILRAMAGPEPVPCPDCLDTPGYAGADACRTCGGLGSVRRDIAEERVARASVPPAEDTARVLPDEQDTSVECPVRSCDRGWVVVVRSWGQNHASRAERCVVCAGTGLVNTRIDATYDGPRKGSRR